MVRVCEGGMKEEKWSGYVKGGMREEKWSGYVKGV